MTPLGEYWLKANLFLLLFYGCYALLLRRHTFLALNRTYLMGSVVLALLLPLVHIPGLSFPWPWETDAPVYTSVSVDAITVVGGVATEAEAPLLPDWPVLAAWLFWLVAAGLLLRTGWRTVSLLRLIRQWPGHPFIDHTLVLPNNAQLPTFSFFRYLVLNPDDAQTEAVRQHELVHIRQKHSLDVLFLEVVQALCWPNPALFGYRQAIRQVHEYLADRDATPQTPTHRDAYARFLVSYAFHLPTDSLAHSFGPDRPNSPTLKQRIQMLYQQHTRRRALWKYALVLPLAIALLAMTSAPESDLPLITTPASGPLVHVEGSVNDESEKPLPGVAITLKNGTPVTTTDARGKYKIDVPTNAMLVVSFVGFASQEMLVVGKEGDTNIFRTVLAPEGRQGRTIRSARSSWPNSAIAPLVHVEGYVRDATGTYPTVKPLPGANVVVRNGHQGSTTDSKGFFIIDVPAGTELVASFVGFKSSEMKVPATSGGGHVVMVFKLQPTAIDGSTMPTVDLPNSVTEPAPNRSNELFTVVESPPTFPGGMSKLFQFVQDNIRYPEAARQQGVQGKVFVSFVVDTDGSIDQINILKGLGRGCDEEAVRVVAIMPKWIPGRQSGRPVAVQYSLPINFQLGETKKAGMNVPSSLLLQMDSLTQDKPPSYNTGMLRNEPIQFGGKNPLIFLNGKEISQESIKDIDPNTIQSIDVLKNASATSQYGEKGKNGVVRITTRAVSKDKKD